MNKISESTVAMLIGIDIHGSAYLLDKGALPEHIDIDGGYCEDNHFYKAELEKHFSQVPGTVYTVTVQCHESGEWNGADIDDYDLEFHIVESTRIWPTDEVIGYQAAVEKYKVEADKWKQISEERRAEADEEPRRLEERLQYRKEELKPGDTVVMHSCVEAEKYDGKLLRVRSREWECSGHRVVLLEGLVGGYAVRNLQKVILPSEQADLLDFTQKVARNHTILKEGAHKAVGDVVTLMSQIGKGQHSLEGVAGELDRISDELMAATTGHRAGEGETA